MPSGDRGQIWNAGGRLSHSEDSDATVRIELNFEKLRFYRLLLGTPYFGMPLLSTVSQHQEGELPADGVTLCSLDDSDVVSEVPRVYARAFLRPQTDGAGFLSQEASSPPSEDRAAHSITFERAAGHRGGIPSANHSLK